MVSLLTSHHACVTEETLQWSSFLPPSGLGGGGNCHRDIAAALQCLVDTE